MESNKITKKIEYIIKLIEDYKKEYELSDNEIIDISIIETHLKTLL